MAIISHFLIPLVSDQDYLFLRLLLADYQRDS